MAPRKKTEKQSAVTEKNIFEKIAEQNPVIVTPVDLDGDIHLEVRNRIGFAEMLKLVNTVVGACVDEDRGETRMEVFECAIQAAICSAYCGITLPEDTEAVYAAVCGKDGLFEEICQYIDENQLDDIYTSAQSRIDAKQELFASSAAKLVIDMMKQISELFEVIGNVTDDFNSEEAMKSLDKLTNLIEVK